MSIKEDLNKRAEEKYIRVMGMEPQTPNKKDQEEDEMLNPASERGEKRSSYK